MREEVVVVLAIVFLVVFWPSSINGDTDPSDAAALRIMYSSLNLPLQLTKWNSSSGDPCGESWKGITCLGSRVAEIKLAGLGLTGSMGYQLSSLTAVTNFDMSNNNLRNQIPYQLPPKVQQLYALNLADNGFSGDIPYSISQMTSLKHLNLSHNQLQGQLSDMFGKLSALSTLDLSFNYLTGTLPESFNSLSSMTYMYLQNNQFTGAIDILSSLPLKNLDVENNHFNGLIPDQLKNINIQDHGNSWSLGPAPLPPPDTSPASGPDQKHKSGGNEIHNDHNREDGNSWSLGPAPLPPPGTSPASGPDQKHKSGGNHPSDGSDRGGVSKKLGMGVGVIVGVVISILVVGALVAFFVMKRKPSKSSTDVEKLNQHFAPLASPEMQETRSIQTSSRVSTKMYGASASINLRDPPIDPHESVDEDHFSRKSVVTKKVNTTLIDAVLYSIADLQMATDNFNIENLIGEGSTGRVFQAHFGDGKVVAVKKIISSALSNHLSEDFMDIVSHVSQLHHPNITKLVGYCSEHGQNLLVYEFHKNGSLHEWLHLCDEYRRPLIWNSRVKIALGTARALEYLHQVCSPSVVHKNLKSANILLDAALNPLLSDSGLASSVLDADQALNYNVGFGYGAPEVAMSGQYTIKSDIYSFGVVMLELLTGRKPFDSSRPGTEQSLVQWATPQLHDIDALLKIVDPALKGLYPVKSLSHFADVIALCLQTVPEVRPSMSEVVQALVMLLQRSSMSRRTFGKEFNYLP